MLNKKEKQKGHESKEGTAGNVERGRGWRGRIRKSNGGGKYD
jgi:hypothetical protein